MSDCIIKIIPKDSFYKVSDLTLQSAKSFLQTQIRCDFIEVEVNETPMFVDCGENLAKISCPKCGTELDFEWWGDTMNKAAECEFISLKTEMPCCKRIISLNDLDYYFPCGFASALEPHTMDSLSDAELNTKLQHSYEQSLAGECLHFNEVFDKLEKSLVQ